MGNTATVEYIRDQDHVIYEVIATNVSDASVNLAVREVVAWKASSFEPVELEPVLVALIKWDGCSHWTYERNLHFCGAADIKQHADLHRQLYLIAFRLMGRDPEWDE